MSTPYSPGTAYSPHNDLRLIERTLREIQWLQANAEDPVWGALDRLWDYVMKQQTGETR